MENHEAEDDEQVIFDNNPAEENNVMQLPPGFRFDPTDEELLDDYLLKQVYGKNSPEGLRIPAVDLYSDAPRDLTARYTEHCEKQWYFFTKRNRKYSGGNRPNRAAGNGFWKQTNVIKRVFKVHKDKSTKVELGRKITLDYYVTYGKSINKRTDWKMNEYRVNEKLPNLPIDYTSAGSTTELDEWCLCRIYISLRKKNKTDNVEAEEENEQVPDDELVPDDEQQNAEHIIAAAAQGYPEQVPDNVQQNAEHIIAAAAQGYPEQVPDDAFFNFNDPLHFEDAIDGLMEWMSDDDDFGILDDEEIYPEADELHDNGFVQPATEIPILPSHNFNPSPPGDVTRDPEDGQCSADGGFKNGGSDQSGN